MALDLPPEGLRVVGRNGSGKTTLLEAIELVSTTRPRRGANDGDLIAYDSGTGLGVQPYARVVVDVARDGANARVEVFVQRTERRNATKKLMRIGERPRRAGDVVGLVPTVSFTPDDLELVLGAPSTRRRFLDIFLSQVDRRYLRTLSRFAKILAQRNGLLRTAADAEPGAVNDQLAYWDEQLVGLGAYVIAARVRALGQISVEATRRFRELSPDAGTLSVTYTPTIQQSDAWWQHVRDSEDVGDAAQSIGAEYERQLRLGRLVEFARGVTLLGPHRDDITFMLNDRVLSRFGSRGQQRIAVMATKMAEFDLATRFIGMRPVLLLDDVLSELDPIHREALLTQVGTGGGQLFVTATERALVERPELARLPIIELRSGGTIDIT